MNWAGVAGSRFRGSDPALQALDFVRQLAHLTEDQKSLLDGRFPITTLGRLLSTPSVREDRFRNQRRQTHDTTASGGSLEAVATLVIDLAEKKFNVTKPQQLEYVSNLGKADTPDLDKKAGAARELGGITHADFQEEKSTSNKKKSQRIGPRTTIVPKSCRLNITNPKMDGIYGELRKLRLDTFPNGIAVLLRVFVQTSVDHYLTSVPGGQLAKPRASPGAS